MPRKQAFSGKQKKRQLQERKERRKDQHGCYDKDEEEEEEGRKPLGAEVEQLNQQPVGSKGFDPNRYRLHFVKISQEEMRKRKAAASKPVLQVSEADLEMSVDSVHGSAGQSLDFPKRPPWDYSLSKAQLEKQERAYFHSYVEKMLTSQDPERLSYFEVNLETWRQLWRVTEISDLLLLIADIRYPVLQLPPSLYRYLREELGREVVLVLNKVDLAPPPLVAAWRAYLLSTFPQAHLVCFSSFPESLQLTASGLFKKRKKKAVKPLGPQDLLDLCKGLVGDKVKLDSWQRKIDTENVATSAPEKHEGQGDDHLVCDQSDDSAFAGLYQKFRNGVLTIGCIGFPNVGKSSLLNGLVGRKVVSVSKTPGHTKHLQTIFLTPTVRLCDCPGLVFPSHVDKSLQILSGIFPVAQVREPYSSVGYLAQRLPLPSLLHLTHPDQSPTPSHHTPHTPRWSPLEICEAWAIRSGFFTAKAARPDMYRAANQILRMCVEGRLRLCFTPPGYSDQQETWQNDPFAESLKERLRAQACEGSDKSASESDSDSEEQGSERDGEEEEEVPTVVHSNPFALLCDD